MIRYVFGSFYLCVIIEIYIMFGFLLNYPFFCFVLFLQEEIFSLKVTPQTILAEIEQKDEKEKNEKNLRNCLFIIVPQEKKEREKEPREKGEEKGQGEGGEGEEGEKEEEKEEKVSCFVLKTEGGEGKERWMQELCYLKVFFYF